MHIIANIILIAKKRRRQLVLVVIVLLAIGGYMWYTQNVTSKDSLADSHVVQRGTLVDDVILSGEIKASEQVGVHFQTGGRLAALHVQEGDTVEKGQILASLDQRELRKQLEKSLNSYSKSRWDFDQQLENVEDTAITDAMQRIVDKSQFDLNSAVVDVELANLTIQFANIYSPVGGLVTSTNNLVAGVNVTALDTIHVVNPDSVYFELTADQTEVITLSEGMLGKLTLDAYPDEEKVGTIDRISFTPKTDEISTVYAVHFSFIDSNSVGFKYRVGMTGDVAFTTLEKQNAVVIPFEFLQREGDESFVWVMENGQLLKRPVETGLETDDEVEIISGISEGEIIYDQDQ